MKEHVRKCCMPGYLVRSLASNHGGELPLARDSVTRRHALFATAKLLMTLNTVQRHLHVGQGSTVEVLISSCIGN
jgi:hypothetical protein